MVTSFSPHKLSILVLLSCGYCQSSEDPQVPVIKIGKNPFIGSQTVITCSSSGAASLYEITIIKDGKNLIARKNIHDELFVNETLKDRVNATGDIKKQEGNLSLTVKKVHCDDTGNYTCVVNTEGGNVYSEAVSLIAAVKPESIKIASTKVKEETTLELTCTGNIGNPPGNFTWLLCRENKANCTLLSGSIEHGDAEALLESCQYNGTSTLMFNYSNDSSMFYIQCLVTYHNDGSFYSLSAWEKFEFPVISTSVKEDQKNGGLTYIEPVVGVSAFLVAFVVISLVIYLIKSKRKKTGEECIMTQWFYHKSDEMEVVAYAIVGTEAIPEVLCSEMDGGFPIYATVNKNLRTEEEKEPQINIYTNIPFLTEKSNSL